MLITTNMFKDNKIIGSIVNLGDNTKVNSKIQKLGIWFKNFDELKKQYPSANVTVKNTFGFYSSSTVCLPYFYSKSLLASNFSFALMSFNLFLIALILIGYILIYYKVRSSRVHSHLSNNRIDPERIFMIRVSLIVATDIVCWLPIIFFTYTNYFGWKVPSIIIPLSSIVILPINSFVNPFLYSRVEVILYKILKYCLKKIVDDILVYCWQMSNIVITLIVTNVFDTVTFFAAVLCLMCFFVSEH